MAELFDGQLPGTPRPERILDPTYREKLEARYKYLQTIARYTHIDGAYSGPHGDIFPDNSAATYGERLRIWESQAGLFWQVPFLAKLQMIPHMIFLAKFGMQSALESEPQDLRPAAEMQQIKAELALDYAERGKGRQFTRLFGPLDGNHIIHAQQLIDERKPPPPQVS